MLLTEKNLRAARMWAAAEGRENGQGKKPTRQERARAQFALSESIAAGEFPTAVLPAVRRTLNVVYERVERVTEQFTELLTVPYLDEDVNYDVASFGDQSNIPDTNMGDQFVPGGLPTIGRREKYPQLGFIASGKTFRASKVGEAFGIDWEAIVKSKGAKINLVRSAITTFGLHAANEEELRVFKLLVGSGGFKTGAGQALNASKAATTANNADFSVNNPDLSDPEDIQAAVALANQARLTVGTGSTINTISVNYGKFILLTAPSNAPRLRQVLQARRLRRVPPRTGTPSTLQGTEYEETMDLGAEIEVVGSKWLKDLWPSIGKGWILIPVADEDDLPVLGRVRLEDYETPQVWIKDSNARNASGGEVNPEVDGDFDSDALETKVRHAAGGAAMWTEGIVYSTGANA